MAKKIKKIKPTARKVAKAKAGRKPRKDEVALLKQKMGKLRSESNAKEAETNRLREEVEYKNRQLASKDMDMDNYRKVAEEKIFRLEARVKELEAKIGAPSTSP